MAVFAMKAFGPPAGVYSAKFLGVEPTSHAKYGPGYRFDFEVLSSGHAGRRASRVTGAVPTPFNALGKMLNGLAGRELKASEEIDVNHYVGRPYQVTVEESKPGFTRVSAVMPS